METLYPAGLESVHPRFAISWRNKWMVQVADVVVSYITHSWGGAAQFVELAERKHKRVINIASMMNTKIENRATTYTHCFSGVSPEGVDDP